MAANQEINDESGVCNCFGNVARKLRNAKGRVRHFCSYLIGKCRSVLRRYSGYARLGGPNSSTHMEPPIIHQDMSMILDNACDRTERDLYDLEMRIRVAFQLHQTSHYTGVEGIWTIEELNRRMDDLESKIRVLMWIWGTCNADKSEPRFSVER